MFLRSTCTSLHVHTCTLSFSVSFQNMCMFDLLVYTTKHQHLGPNHRQWLQSYHVDLYTVTQCILYTSMNVTPDPYCSSPPKTCPMLPPSLSFLCLHVPIMYNPSPQPSPPFPLTCSYNSHSRSRTWCTLSFYDAPCVSFRPESPSPPISFSPRTSTAPAAPSTPMSAPP